MVIHPDMRENPFANFAAFPAQFFLVAGWTIRLQQTPVGNHPSE